MDTHTPQNNLTGKARGLEMNEYGWCVVYLTN